MTEPQRAIDAAITAAERLRQLLRKGKSKQVSADDERSVIKATALTWFNTHRQIVTGVLSTDLLGNIDTEYRSILAASEKATLRKRHLECLKLIKKGLAQIQSEHVLSLAATQTARRETSDSPPHFTPLVTDLKMQQILGNRWQECVKCVENGAPLAAVVMMGGILEGLLLARVNQLTDKSPVFRAASAPKDKVGTPLVLKDWGLNNFLDVSYELKWISRTTRDVGGVVRDYRNYVHPQKEYSHGVTISAEDARMLWEIAKSVARQVLKP